MFEIEKNVPVPRDYGKGIAGLGDVFRALKKGESFVVSKEQLQHVSHGYIYAMAKYFGNKLNRKFVVHKFRGNARVWRVTNDALSKEEENQDKEAQP